MSYPVNNSAKPRKISRPRQIGDLVATAINDVVAQRSGMSLDLIGAWEDIVGEEFAGFTWPEKITWPHHDGSHSAGNDTRLQSGMLILACDGARAVFLQHQNQEIISRLNRFFGFEAIDRIKIVQKPVSKPQDKRKKTPALNAEEEAQLQKMLSKIDDPQLKNRLCALGRGVLAKNKTDE